jgi:hypothetical protein
MNTLPMIVLVSIAVFACRIVPIPLGIRAAKKRNRSPHWMWFGAYPILGWIAFALLSSLPPLKECPQCAEKVKAHAKVCRYCTYRFDT